MSLDITNGTFGFLADLAEESAGFEIDDQTATLIFSSEAARKVFLQAYMSEDSPWGPIASTVLKITGENRFLLTFHVENLDPMALLMAGYDFDDNDISELAVHILPPENSEPF